MGEHQIGSQNAVQTELAQESDRIGEKTHVIRF